MSNEDSSPASSLSAQIILKNFLAENTNYRIDESKESIAGINEISSDDEIWIVQSPKRLDLKCLVSEKIRLPGKTTCHQLETSSEIFSKEKTICVGFKNEHNFTLKQLPVNGRIVIKNNSKLMESENTNACNPGESFARVPFPSNLLLRHPLHGNKFEDKINLDENVQARLRECDKVIKKHNKLKRRIKRDISDEELSANSNKRDKKKSNRSKKLKRTELLNVKEELDNVSMDLEWIKNM